ncbi:uncharacterized protein BcabD6B2_47090 [Babesia caballi]|uniref:Uncharacterized protein n=1 Tax=Babesia caballi TaxID=5871 RepID=A0AAV4LYU4_BABCB|nr:hypothetical protein, conserved [Babesia caballi]
MSNTGVVGAKRTLHPLQDRLLAHCHVVQVALRPHAVRRRDAQQRVLLRHQRRVELGGPAHQRDVGEPLEVQRVPRHADGPVERVVQRHDVATGRGQRGHLLGHLAHAHVVRDEVRLRLDQPVVPVEGEVRHARVGEDLDVGEGLFHGVDRARQQSVRVQPLVGELATQRLVDVRVNHERRQTQVSSLLHLLHQVGDRQQPQPGHLRHRHRQLLPPVKSPMLSPPCRERPEGIPGRRCVRRCP